MVRGLYSLERWTVFGVPLAPAPLESQTVKTMATHRDALEAALGVPVAFALEDATSYRIGRMLETGLPFVERGEQVYLPFLGIALRDGGARASNRRQADVVTFSPQAQRLALMALYGDLDGASVTQAARPSSARRKDDRLARIRRARGRRPLHRRHRGAAAGAASRQGQDGTVASLGAAHVEPGHKGALPGPHTRRRTPAGRDFGAVRALDAAGQPLADLHRDQSARARLRAGGRRARGRRRRACVRGAGAALRARAGTGVRGRPAFCHPVPSRRREGRPARRG